MSGTGSINLRFLHQFPDFRLDLDLTIPGRGVSAIFGPSGSGKTTLLRCMAGLERAQKGRLIVNGESWQDDDGFLPTHKRPLGYVFQEASLFPHLTALGNLQYAMKRAGAERRTKVTWLRSRHDVSEQAAALDEAVALLGIAHLLDRYPHQLSGGERQRVAIARALLIEPQLLLMDEPLASLDLARKQEILPYLERLHRQLTIPIVYVSHSIDEIARLADYLVVLKDGQTAEAGPLSETLASLDFSVALGDETGVVWDGVVNQIDHQWQLAQIKTSGGTLWIPDGGLTMGQTIRLRILASDVSLVLSQHQDSSFLNILPATITDMTNADTGAALVRLSMGDTPLLSSLTQRSVEHLQLAPGMRVWAQVKSVALLR